MALTRTEGKVASVAKISTVPFGIAYAEPGMLAKLARDPNQQKTSKTEITKVFTHRTNGDKTRGVSFAEIKDNNGEGYAVIEHVKIGDTVVHVLWGIGDDLRGTRISTMNSFFSTTILSAAKESKQLAKDVLWDTVEVGDGMRHRTLFREGVYERNFDISGFISGKPTA
ncbi:MAG: hypothetical protein KGI04_01910 [Candidatus Micrarchaeota archaeon]|nr:hypothetical protein [Candidatus Micrarchaeota archaeon]